jgi:hypothetical protein
MICVLHAKMRILENLIMCVVGRTRTTDIAQELQITETIAKRVRLLPGCQQFAFRKPDDSYETENNSDSEKMQVPYINGPQVDVIFNNFKIIFAGIISQEEIILWELMRVILQCFVCGTTDMLAEKDFSINIQQQLIDACIRLIKTVYPSQLFGHYVHIILIHSVDLRIKYGSLLRFANEGLESAHNTITDVKTRQTNGGGGRFSYQEAPEVQIMLHLLRKLYLTSKLKFPWIISKLKPQQALADKQMRTYRKRITKCLDHASWILSNDFLVEYANIAGAADLPSVTQDTLEDQIVQQLAKEVECRLVFEARDSITVVPLQQQIPSYTFEQTFTLNLPPPPLIGNTRQTPNTPTQSMQQPMIHNVQLLPPPPASTKTAFVIQPPQRRAVPQHRSLMPPNLTSNNIHFVFCDESGTKTNK